MGHPHKYIGIELLQGIQLSVFQYKHLEKGLSEQPTIRQGQYYACRNGSAFLQVSPANKNVAKEINGWKFHMSVDPDNVPEAWNIVQERIVEQGLIAKVTTTTASQKFADEHNPQRGKMITIYDDNSRQRDWGMVLNDIEQQFIEQGIKPGPQVHIDRPVEGSQFTSYMNDRDQNFEYISGKDRKTYNDGGRPDPHSELSINRAPDRQAIPTKTDIHRLNHTLAPAIGRYEDTITSEGFQVHPGSQSVPFPNARLTLSSAEHANEIASALSSAGIEAKTAGKGDAFLVVVPSSASAKMNLENFKDTQRSLVAHEACDTLADKYQSKIPKEAWQTTSMEDEMCGVPSVRISSNKLERAEQLAAHIQQSTGMEAYCMTNEDGGSLPHSVVIPIHDAEQTADLLQATPEQSLGRNR